MRVSPSIYELFIHPSWVTEKYARGNLEKFVGKDFQEKKVLDFGCGTGTNAKIFKENSYVGFDIDSERIELAKKKNQRYFFTNNFGEIEKSKFDIIFIFSVLHHIPDDDIKNYLSEFKKMLTPNGRIFIVEAYISNTNLINDFVFQKFDAGEHLRTEGEIYLLLQDQSFVINKLKKFQTWNFYNAIVYSCNPRNM